MLCHFAIYACSVVALVTDHQSQKDSSSRTTIASANIVLLHLTGVKVLDKYTMYIFIKTDVQPAGGTGWSGLQEGSLWRG